MTSTYAGRDYFNDAPPTTLTSTTLNPTVEVFGGRDTDRSADYFSSSPTPNNFGINDHIGSGPSSLFGQSHAPSLPSMLSPAPPGVANYGNPSPFHLEFSVKNQQVHPVSNQEMDREAIILKTEDYDTLFKYDRAIACKNCINFGGDFGSLAYCVPPWTAHALAASPCLLIAYFVTNCYREKEAPHELIITDRSIKGWNRVQKKEIEMIWDEITDFKVKYYYTNNRTSSILCRRHQTLTEENLIHNDKDLTCQCYYGLICPCCLSSVACIPQENFNFLKLEGHWTAKDQNPTKFRIDVPAFHVESESAARRLEVEKLKTTKDFVLLFKGKMEAFGIENPKINQPTILSDARRQKMQRHFDSRA